MVICGGQDHNDFPVFKSILRHFGKRLKSDVILFLNSWKTQILPMQLL